MEKPLKVILKPEKEAAILRFHPWVFSGAVDRITGHREEGAVADVFSHRGEWLATGHFSSGSIALKIFSFQRLNVDEAFWHDKIRQAFHRRAVLGLTQGMMSDSYRLVFSEGDELPGLIIDIYHDVAVIQTHTWGMYRLVPVFARALQSVYGEALKAVYNKSLDTMNRSNQAIRNDQTASETVADGFVYGVSDPVQITEAGHRFQVDFIRGQKTGFFLDQRLNRLYAQLYAQGKRVLNACCYSGAFSVYALKGGAEQVVSLDSSVQAIAWAKENTLLNGFDLNHQTFIVEDVKKYLAATDEKFGLIVLDPPAFAKNRQVTNNALHAYIRINADAMRALEPGGLLMTFSCSQPVSREMFRSAIQSAAIESRRRIRIVHSLVQAPDHPCDACHPEGEYLKGFIVQAE